MNWREQIEAQIAELHGHVCTYDSRVRSAGDTMQALLDLAVAAELISESAWSCDGYYDGDPALSLRHGKLKRALDKLKEAAND